MIIMPQYSVDAISLIFYRSLVMLTLTIPWSILKDQPPFPPNLSLKDRFLQVLRWVDVLLHRLLRLRLTIIDMDAGDL